MRVVDAIGWRARKLKGQEIPLSDFGPIQLFADSEGKPATISVVICRGQEDRLPLVAEGKHLFVLPLSVRGEVAGLICLMRSGAPVCDDEEAAFLRTTASITSMAICHFRWQREIDERTFESKVIGQIDPSATSGLPFMHLLRTIARAARDLIGSERVTISALGVDGRSRVNLMVYGKRARIFRKNNIPFSGLGHWAIEHGEPAFTNDMANDPRVDPEWSAKLKLHSGAAVPLWIKGRVVGCLSAYNRGQSGLYSERDLSVLSHFAAHAAAAIENASLSERYRNGPLGRTMIWQMLSERRRSIGSLSAIHERISLARELHDGLAQSLSNLNFRLQFIEQKVAGMLDPNRDIVAREVAIVRDVVSGMYDEVRTRISALDTRDARAHWDDNFSRQLRDLIEEFAAQSGAKVDMDLPLHLVKLPPMIGLQLLRIVREALVNAQRHAGATRILVAMDLADRKLTLSIEDDGRGFPSENGRVRKGHFGLSMMRGRAKEIGAQLVVSSGPGKGARVTITLPVS